MSITHRSVPGVFSPATVVLLVLKNTLFTLVLPGSVGVWIPWSLLPDGAPGPAAWHIVLALPWFTLGAAIYAWCLWDFVTLGRATPFPADPPKVLVQRGLYRYVRNPMYIGVLCAVAGWVLLWPSRVMSAYVVSVACLFHLFVLLVEEPILRRKFGDGYRTYLATVPRWMPRRPVA